MTVPKAARLVAAKRYAQFMRTTVNILFLLLTINSFGQRKKIYGTLTDTTLHQKIAFGSACIGDSCDTTNKDGEFAIYIDNYNPKKTYSLNVSYVANDPKTILITDSTKYPLDIILFNYQYKLYQKPTDLRKYDANIKLSSFQTNKCGKINETGLPSKLISKKLTDKQLELTIKYYESCSFKLEPVAKFSSDTLFVLLDDKTIREYEMCGCECCYTTKFIIQGLKSDNFTLRLEDETLVRQKK